LNTLGRIKGQSAISQNTDRRKQKTTPENLKRKKQGNKKGVMVGHSEPEKRGRPARPFRKK